MSTFNFESREKVIQLLKKADDNQETIVLINHMAELRKQRNPFFLKQKEFDEILKWKLRSQFGRQKVIRSHNTESIIRNVTELTFKISHPDFYTETEFRLEILSCLKGVGIPVASAILTLVYPEKYAVIDFRVCRQIFGDRNQVYTTTFYKNYLSIIFKLAQKYKLTPQQIDMAIWQMDIEIYG